MIGFARVRRMPLVQGDDVDAALRDLARADAFTGASSPEGARAGLLLYAGCWSAAHAVAQDLPTPEGSYWHAILHRQEPDAWNAGYWFRKVGKHPVYPALCTAAVEFGYAAGKVWDAERFVEFCEQARARPGSAMERIAIEVQHAEWALLFDWCSRPA